MCMWPLILSTSIVGKYSIHIFFPPILPQTQKATSWHSSIYAKNSLTLAGSVYFITTL